VFADQATQSSDTPWPVGRERDVVTIRTLIILALLVSGFLAGTNIDRALVLMPAWQQVGVSAWAEFSRHANLGNGLIVYPLAGFSATLLTLATAVAAHFDREFSRVTRALLDASALLTAAGLAVTLFAAPVMLGIRANSDPVGLQRAFEDFWFWSNLRGACHVLAFVAQLATLDVLLNQPRPTEK
jgi:hypothetical protein